MQTQVTKWGNSLALRLPKAFAEELGVDEGADVELTLEDGRLIVERARRFSLTELVQGITPDNRHDATDDYGTVGNEAW